MKYMNRDSLKKVLFLRPTPLKLKKIPFKF